MRADTQHGERHSQILDSTARVSGDLCFRGIVVSLMTRMTEIKFVSFVVSH
jgi:hypothetical protein